MSGIQWANFSEGGPWAWWWHRLRAGCLFRHKWVTEDEWESWDEGAAFHVSTYRDCARCEAWQELWHYTNDQPLSSSPTVDAP